MIVATTREHRAVILDIVDRMPNFNAEDLAVVTELIDIYLDKPASHEYTFLSYLREGKVAGFACFGPKPMCDRVIEAYWLGVDPKVHRKGIGKTLMAEVEARAQAQGARMLVLETSGRPDYAATRAFHDARGYAPVARIPDLYAEGDDLVIYRKRWDKPETDRIEIPE